MPDQGSGRGACAGQQPGRGSLPIDATSPGQFEAPQKPRAFANIASIMALTARARALLLRLPQQASALQASAAASLQPACCPQALQAAAAAAAPRPAWACSAALQAAAGPSGRWFAADAKGSGDGQPDAGAAAAASGSGSSSDEDAGAQQAAAGGDAGAEQLQAQLAKAQEEAAAFKDKWQRSHAEMQNLIARQAREKETLQTYAVQKFAESLLEVADNLESAAKAVPGDVLAPGADVPADKALGLLRALLEGVNATERVLLKTMASKGVTRVDVSEGDAFDPNTQEAMSTLPAQGPDAKPGTIAVKWQSGYKIHDRILRAAKVIVYQE